MKTKRELTGRQLAGEAYVISPGVFCPVGTLVLTSDMLFL